MWPLIDQLVQQGVVDFFLGSGSRSTPLVIAASRHPKAQLHCHFDERGLGFYALGHALAKEKPVAIIVTSGTAVGNLMPAVMEAHHSSISLILLTADRPSELRFASANQTTDQIKMFSNFVRWQFDFEPSMPEKAVRSKAAQGVFSATWPHAGPVHLNCAAREPLYPMHEELLEGKPIKLEFAQGGKCSPKQLPSQGLILLGRLPKRSDVPAVLALAKKLKWPVIADILSNARCFPTQEQMRHCDWFLEKAPHPKCVLHFGERMTSKRVMEWLGEIQPEYVHISPLGHWNDSFLLLTEKITADIGSACDALHAIPDPNWLAAWQELDEKTNLTAAHEPFTETVAIQSLSNLEEWSLFFGNGMPIREADWFLFAKAKGFFANRGLSGIDGNIATIAGLSLSTPVIGIIGDMATLHDLNSLSLLQSVNPVILLVSNNNGGGIFSHLAISKEPHFEKLFAFAHEYSFEHAAKMFHLPYFLAEDQKTFSRQIQNAMEIKKSCVIEFVTSREENFASHQRLHHF